MPRRPARAAGAQRPLHVELIGPGRLGEAIAAWLAAPGVTRRARLETVVSRRRRRAQAMARRWGARRAMALAAYQPEGDAVLITVPDDALAGLAAALAARGDWRGRVVLHGSGLQPAAVLAPLRRRGAAIGSLHPLMTFGAGRPAPSPHGLVFALEGQPAAVQIGERLIAAWGGVGLRLRAAEKPRYHLAAMWASPFVVTNFAIAAEVLRRAGLRGRRLTAARRGMAQLLLQTSANLAAAAESPRGDLMAAWTGPIARDDRATIRRHLAAAGAWAPLYRAMAREAERRLGRQRR